MPVRAWAGSLDQLPAAHPITLSVYMAVADASNVAPAIRMALFVKESVAAPNIRAPIGAGATSDAMAVTLVASASVPYRACCELGA